MPPKKSVHITFELRDPGEEAQNYRFRVANIDPLQES